MTYLNALRLHFAGRVRVSTATMNHAAVPSNTAFASNTATAGDPAKGSNTTTATASNSSAQGHATALCLRGCKVTTAWSPSGPVTFGDPVLEYLVVDSNTEVRAKWGYSESEQRRASEHRDSQVCIVNAQGERLLTGELRTAAFSDVWIRASSGGDRAKTVGATYQSLLTASKWGDVSRSPFLLALREAAPDGLLSVKFNVDGFELDPASPQFVTGRVVGTIGPTRADEGRQLELDHGFTVDRHRGGRFVARQGHVTEFPVRIDGEACVVYLDLGNTLSTRTPGGALDNVGDLTLWVYVEDSTETPVMLGKIPAGGASGYASNRSWYLNTAGVVALPLNPKLLPLVHSGALVLEGNPNAKVSVRPRGVFVRSGSRVYRELEGVFR